MNKIKIGLKIWSSNEDSMFKEAQKLFDEGMVSYIEIYTVPGTFDKTIDKLKKITAPIVLHAPHIGNNFNISDKNLFESNLEMFKEVRKFATELGNPKMVMHLGQGEREWALKCLEEFDYKNILIENLPKVGINYKENRGYTVDEIKFFLDKGYGFCLDLAHAIKAAHTLKRNFREFIREFMVLKPDMFHLYDGDSNEDIDKHMNFGEGNFDLKFLKEVIEGNDNTMTSFEVPKSSYSNLESDIKNIEYFNKI